MNQTLTVEAPNFLQTTPAQGSLTSIAADKAVAEVQAMLTIAKRFPRDEARAYQKIQTACQRPMLAEAARYTYSRGGSEITGPSIRLAEAIAQLWGNITWGWKEIERGRDISTCQAYAWDMENNVRREADFQVPHYRDTKGGRKPLKDDRDIYEMCANMAARRVRACLLNVIPGDITEMAEQECDATLSNNEKVTPETVKKMLEGLAGYGVTRAQVEKRIGRSMDAITPGQMVSLRRVYVGLRDGMGKVEDYFEILPAAESTTADQPQQGVNAVKEKLKAKKPEQAKGNSPQREAEKQLLKEALEDAKKKAADKARQIVDEVHQEEEAKVAAQNAEAAASDLPEGETDDTESYDRADLPPTDADEDADIPPTRQELIDEGYPVVEDIVLSPWTDYEVLEPEVLKRIASLLIFSPGKYDLDPTPEYYDRIGGKKLSTALKAKGGSQLELEKLHKKFEVPL